MKTIGADGISRHPEAKLGPLQPASLPRPEDKQRGRGRRKEDPVAKHDVVQQIAVAASEGQDNGPDRLEDDRGGRRAVAGVQPAPGWERRVRPSPWPGRPGVRPESPG